MINNINSIYKFSVTIIKRNHKEEAFDVNKPLKAIKKAYNASKNSKGTIGIEIPELLDTAFCHFLQTKHPFNKDQGNLVAYFLPIERMQDIVENFLLETNKTVAKTFIIYREKHKELRIIKERADYITTYVENGDNAATSSEIDANANIQNKNVATLEAELYKTTNVEVSRYRVQKMLDKLYPNKNLEYSKDLEKHILYKHDEGSSPAIKPYCVAVNMYPFMQFGTATLDGLNTTAPHNLDSFTGQFNNLVFLLSSQFQGAIAFGEFFNVFNYYCVKDFGRHYYTHTESIVEEHTKDNKKTIKNVIEQAFQNIVYSINQPAGNRSYQSPFTNISYYDSNYWKALFNDFVYPDGTKPEWEAIDYLQRLFLKWFNAERKKCLLTFPVETMALLTDSEDIIDKDYKDLLVKSYTEGHSFFTYISDNADSLSSCCRLKNKLEKNTFNFTSGLTGVATGSKSVITINLNRLVQESVKNRKFSESLINSIKKELKEALDSAYMYHTAYNEILWDLCDHNMLPVYSKGFINLNQQFLTIGINGLNEAAEFLNIQVNNNKEYEEFCNLITATISQCNREAEIKYNVNAQHKLKFNTEFVPAENLAIKNYNWDKADGYQVPSDRNCYNSYFYKPDDDTVSVLEKFQLHGKRYVDTLDGGVALHCNLDAHLSYEQYQKLVEFAVQNGTNYFTFNIPNSSCDNCGYISKSPLTECPICKSKNITYWTRIIGYLRPTKAFSKGRKVEESKRIYHKEK